MDLLKTTVTNYQKILDIINERKDENGIAEIKIQDFMKELKRSRTWCKNNLVKINEYEKVIEYLGNDKYTTNYEDINDTKMFKILYKMMYDTINDINIVKMGDFELMKKYKINRKMVQKYRSYVTSGWKKGEINES